MQNVGILIFRVGIGLMMMFPHGWDKLIGFGQRMNTFPDPLGIGSKASLALTVFAEFFCSVLIMIGFKTRIASAPLFICMIVAGFAVHGADPWARKEKAILYALCYLVLLFIGSGKFSIDGLMGEKGTKIKSS
jgi:putative oxidoreductase